MKNKAILLVLTLGIALAITTAGTFFTIFPPVQAIEFDVIGEMSIRICPVVALENHIASGRCMNCITDEQCPAIQRFEYAILNGFYIHETAAQEAAPDTSNNNLVTPNFKEDSYEKEINVCYSSFSVSI